MAWYMLGFDGSFRSSLVGAALVFACGTESAPPPTPAAGETGAAQAADAPDAEGVPKIAAAEPVHEFGGIKASDTVEHVFAIKNEGTADLKIDHVQRT